MLYDPLIDQDPAIHVLPPSGGNFLRRFGGRLKWAKWPKDRSDGDREGNYQMISMVTSQTVDIYWWVLQRPFLPDRPEDIREFAVLLRSDFEIYIADIQDYFRCLDAERQRAFHEA